MALHGVSHIGLSTLDFEATRTFYEDVLGFRLVTIEQIDLEEGGCIRHAFFDCGDGELLGFMEPRRIEAVPAEYDTGINRGLGVPDWFYHLAFDAGSVEELHAKRSELIAKGVKVTPIVDHDWILSIYFKDPNGLLLEYAAQTRAPADPQVSAGPTHYGYLAPTLPYYRFPGFLVLRSHVKRRLRSGSENVVEVRITRAPAADPLWRASPRLHGR